MALVPSLLVTAIQDKMVTEMVAAFGPEPLELPGSRLKLATSVATSVATAVHAYLLTATVTVVTACSTGPGTGTGSIT